MVQLNVISKIIEKSVTNDIIPIEHIGRVANQVTANHVFTDYTNRKITHTIKSWRAALDLFGEYLDVVGIPGQSAGNLQTDPRSWRSITWGIVEEFIKWCLKEGYVVSTVNNRLSAVKVYAKLAAKVGVIPAEELQHNRHHCRAKVFTLQ